MAPKTKPGARPAAPRLASEAQLFRILSDPHRLRILTTLARGCDEICVCDLNDCVPLGQPTVSHHLKVLKEAGLVESRRHATWIYYRLVPGARARMKKAFDSIFGERSAA